MLKAPKVSIHHENGEVRAWWDKGSASCVEITHSKEKGRVDIRGCKAQIEGNTQKKLGREL